MNRRKLTRLLTWGVALLPPLFLLALFELLKGDKSLMDAWVTGFMEPLEQFLGRVWSLLPWFSAAEALAALFLLGSAAGLIRAAALLVRDRAGWEFLGRLAAFGAVLLWLWAGVCWMWNAAYYASSFQEKSGLHTQPYSVDKLERVTALFAQRAAEFSVQVARDENGLFAEGREEIFSRGVSVYDGIQEEFPFLAVEEPVRAKPIFFSRLQSILGFTGVYFPFTGEANVNVDAPACMLPATIAHEMAHQRMTASEQEANFVGIAACIASDDPVFQYSGWLMGLIHLCNALYSVSPDTWYAIAGARFTPELSQDWNDNNAYWDAFDSPVEDAATDVYDSFLKGNGQELGIRSYGACVDLLVAYFGKR